MNLVFQISVREKRTDFTPIKKNVQDITNVLLESPTISSASQVFISLQELPTVFHLDKPVVVRLTSYYIKFRERMMGKICLNHIVLIADEYTHLRSKYFNNI